MKTKLFVVIAATLLTACSENNNGSDAWGNFESKEIMVSAEAQGKIIQLTIEEGDVLEKNQLIGVIDTTMQYLQKQQLIAQKQAVSTKIANVNAQIAVQEEQKQNLVNEKNRIEKLFIDKAATQQQFDDITSKYEIVNKQIAATKTQIDAIYKELNVIDKQIDVLNEQIRKARIINPINGTVLEKYIEEGEITAMGKAIYKISKLDEIDIRVYVSGAQLPMVKIGQAVTVFIDKDEKENQQYEGVVSWISNQAEFTPKIIQTKEERVNLVYAVKVRVKNDGNIKIGMPGEVKFSITN
ncbi:MAG: HlyD family secretion protein [Bacteroidales bacterium]